MPLGTAHETPTPSFSSRKSQCNRRAWCSWTTNRGALTALRGTLAPGSGVRLKSRLASYSASFLATLKRLLVLCELHLEADPSHRDLGRLERAFRNQAFELGRRIRAAAQHLQRRLGREGAECSELHRPDLAVDVGVGGIPAHVLDHRDAATAQDPMHLGKGALRQGEVLERGLADDQVEGFGGERHGGHVSLAKVNRHVGFSRVSARDLHERVADVEPGDLKPSQPRDLDRQVAGTRCHLEHRGAIGQPGGELRSLLSVNLDLALRAPNPGVPPCHRALHLRAFESPTSRFHRLHVNVSFERNGLAHERRYANQPRAAYPASSSMTWSRSVSPATPV